MDPEWASILGGPLSAFKPLEAVHHKRSPRLVHRQAHDTVIFLEKRLIRLVSLLLPLTILDNFTLNRQSKFIKWILVLQPRAKRGLQLVELL